MDPGLIHENFDEIYGWAQMKLSVQLYDVDMNRLKRLQSGPLYQQNLKNQDNQSKDTQNLTETP